MDDGQTHTQNGAAASADGRSGTTDADGAGLPLPGTPLTGGGGALPRFAPSQVTPRTVVVVVSSAVAVITGLFLLWQLRQIVQWTVIALFLAVALSPPVNWLVRQRVPRAPAILLVYLLLLIAVAGLGALVVPPLVEQARQLADYIAARAREPGGLTQALEDMARRYRVEGYVQSLRAQVSALPGRLNVAAGPLLAVTRGIISSVTALVSILLLTFFLLLDSERFLDAALRLFNPAQRPRLQRILGQSAAAIHGYVNGNLAISLIAGVASFAAMTILRMPYAVALALVVALFDLLPLVGAILGASITVLVALFVDPLKAGILAVFFLIYQQIENNVLQPLVYGRSVRQHPLVIFLAVLAGGKLLGILGALLAIPAAEIIRILGTEWLAGRARETGGMPHSADEGAPVEEVVADAAGPTPQPSR